MKIIQYLDENPIRSIPIVNDKFIEDLPKFRPDALVYTVPISGAKIISSEDEGAWKGLVFNPEKTSSTFAWHSENLNLSAWAKTPNITRAILFVSSRIDDEGLAHFQIPNTKFIISGKWDDEKKRFESGLVTDTSDKRQQKWNRSGWFSSMEPGFFNSNANIRRMQNMLCGVMTVGDGGLEKKIPF